MSVEQQIIRNGQYTIRVPLKASLDANQVESLVNALQRSYDDGASGLFEVGQTEDRTVVLFYREMSDDLEVIQMNIGMRVITSSDPTEAVVEQLALELALHQDEHPCVEEIVATLRELGAALLDAADHAMVREFMRVDQASPAEGVVESDVAVLVARIEADIALLRKVCVDPMSIKISENIDIEVRHEEDDDRVLVGRTGWGHTVVNYTKEGLVLDVFGHEELAPVHTASIYADDLEPPEEGVEFQRYL